MCLYLGGGVKPKLCIHGKNRVELRKKNVKLLTFPVERCYPSLKKNVMLGAIAGFVLAAGVIVLMTILNDTIKSEDDIEKYLGIPTLANIPDRKDYISGKASKKKKRKKRRRQEKWQNKK